MDSEVRLEQLYTVTFTTPEAWSVDVAADDGTEGRGFLLAEGRSTGCDGCSEASCIRPTTPATVG